MSTRTANEVSLSRQKRRAGTSIGEQAGIEAIRKQSRWMVAPALILLIGLGLFPTLYTIYLMFIQWVLSSGKPAVFNGLGNFSRLLADDRFLSSLLKTINFTIGAVTIEPMLGLAIALLLSGMASYSVRLFFILPMVIAPTVVGLIWRFMFNNEIGVINYLLKLIGLDGPLWLGDPQIAPLAIVIVDVWQWTPFIILILFAGLLSISPDILEAAVVDGAGWWTMLWSIKIQLILPAIAVAVIFRAMDALRTFDSIYVLTAGGPNNVTEVLSLYTYKEGFRFFEISYSAVLAFLLMLVVLISSRLMLPLFRRK